MKLGVERLTRRAVMVVAVVATALLGFAGTASADAYGTKSLTVDWGGKGTATWYWDSDDWGYMYNIDMTVKDTDCDGNGVYMFFRVYTAHGDEFTTDRRWADQGCGKSVAYRNLHIGPLERNDQIVKIRLQLVVNREGGKISGDIDNPVNPNNNPCGTC